MLFQDVFVYTYQDGIQNRLLAVRFSPFISRNNTVWSKSEHARHDQDENGEKDWDETDGVTATFFFFSFFRANVLSIVLLSTL